MNNQLSIIWGTRQIQASQLALYVGCGIKYLKAMGVKPGDRFVVCNDNSVEYVILLLALWQSKAVAAPVNPRWPEKTVAAYAAKINAKHILRDADIKRLVCFDARYETGNVVLADWELEQEVTIVATSGSSGEAKAVVHTWGNHFYSAQGSQAVIPLASGDCWLLSLPLYHVSGISIVCRCLCAGACVVMPGNDLAEALASGKVTHVSLVATQLQRLLEDEKNHAALSALKCILLGGSAIPLSLLEQCSAIGLKVYVSYGLTEMSSQVATGRVDAQGARAKVLPHRQLCIAPDGEVLVKGEVLFKGYVVGQRVHLPLKNSCHSRESGNLNDKGWFATGDLGRLDAQGCLTIFGRKDNMFISGGENIQPEEIEKALLGIKGISEAVVVPKADGEFGHRPVAFIKFIDKPISGAVLVKRLQMDLPGFKIPVAFYPWPQGLMTQGIKVSRRDLVQKLPRA